MGFSPPINMKRLYDILGIKQLEQMTVVNKQGEQQKWVAVSQERNPIFQSLSVLTHAPLSDGGISYQDALAFKEKQSSRGTFWHHSRPLTQLLATA